MHGSDEVGCRLSNLPSMVLRQAAYKWLELSRRVTELRIRHALSDALSSDEELTNDS